MKISARNQFRGKVAKVTPGAVNTEVVVALFKASSVLVMTADAGLRLSARNSLAGKVTALRKGPIHAEVTIGLPSGDAVHATITHAACDGLGLAEGVAATAVIKAPFIILGVPA